MGTPGDSPGEADRGEKMKRWKWLAAAGAVTVCVILFIGKDDMIKYRRMRQM
jgi:hypothetical protein